MLLLVLGSGDVGGGGSDTAPVVVVGWSSCGAWWGRAAGSGALLPIETILSPSLLWRNWNLRRYFLLEDEENGENGTPLNDVVICSPADHIAELEIGYMHQSLF